MGQDDFAAIGKTISLLVCGNTDETKNIMRTVYFSTTKLVWNLQKWTRNVDAGLSVRPSLSRH